MIKPVKFETQRHTSIATIVLFACLFICSSSRCLFAVDIEISKFDIVSTNVSTNIIVTLVQSPGTEEVCLTLRSIKGMGGAVFLPGGRTSTNISQTSILRITGNKLSSIESNMVLEANVGKTIVASNIFTVVDMISESKTVKTMAPAKKDKVKNQERMIAKSKAIEIARVAMKGKEMHEGAPITVELKGRDYIVTFGYIRPSPKEQPGWRGPSYTFKVVLDAFTGSVKQIISGS